MTAWLKNDDLFRSELEEGHRWSQLVVDRLVAAGLDASVTPMEWRKDILDRDRFEDEWDIEVETAAGRVLLESKSRRLRFDETSESYPYRTALIDTVTSWDRKRSERRAVVLTSQWTKAMLIVPVLPTRHTWTIFEGHDPVRRLDEDWYEVDRSLLRPMDDLIAWLRSRNSSMEQAR